MTMSTINDNDKAEQLQKSRKDHDTCNKYVESGLNRNMTVKFLMERLIAMGCTPPKGFINCIDCGTKYASGGFGVVEEERVSSTCSSQEEDHKIDTVTGTMTGAGSAFPSSSSSSSSSNSNKIKHECSDTYIFDKLPKQIEMQRNNPNAIKLRLLPEIFLCQQHLVSEEHAHQALVHELIHAIDLCRTKMDPINNCIHMACTEIRAENLSGECNLMREVVNRRVSNFKGHGAECVKRRALLSVKANPVCKERAEEFVDAAFDRCFKDTYPFDRHPNLR